MGQVWVDVISTSSRLLLESMRGFQLGQNRTFCTFLSSYCTFSSTYFIIWSIINTFSYFFTTVADCCSCLDKMEFYHWIKSRVRHHFEQRSVVVIWHFPKAMASFLSSPLLSSTLLSFSFSVKPNSVTRERTGHTHQSDVNTHTQPHMKHMPYLFSSLWKQTTVNIFFQDS